jgi:carbonic anhydrase/acetyltransferase-like protein (isoleucine patch superfamily)
MLAAGALLAPGKAVPPRELWTGRPARFMRGIADDELAAMGRQTALYRDLAERHAASSR